MALTNKKLLHPLQQRLEQNFISDLEKSIEYYVSAVSEALSNPFVCPLPRIKISLLLLLARTEELISTPKIMAFVTQLKFGIEKSERESNPIPHPE